MWTHERSRQETGSARDVGGRFLHRLTVIGFLVSSSLKKKFKLRMCTATGLSFHPFP